MNSIYVYNVGILYSCVCVYTGYTARLCVCATVILSVKYMNWIKWTFFCFDHKTKPETYFYRATRPVRKDTRIRISTYYHYLSASTFSISFSIWVSTTQNSTIFDHRKLWGHVFLFLKQVQKNTIWHINAIRFHQSMQ